MRSVAVGVPLSDDEGAPAYRYRLDGDDLVWDRAFGRARNAVVLPAGGGKDGPDSYNELIHHVHEVYLPPSVDPARVARLRVTGGDGRPVRDGSGAEITLEGGAHLTLLVEDAAGYRNLCRLITAAHAGDQAGLLFMVLATPEYQLS